MILTAAELAALDAGSCNFGAFFRLETDPVVALWLGFGDIKPGVDTYDPGGTQIYKGFGTLMGVPAFQQLIGGKAESLDLNLNSFDPNIVALAMSDADSVKLKPCRLGTAIMDHLWNLVGPIRWPFNGTAQFIKIRVQPAGSPGDATLKTVSLRVASQFSGVGRRGASYWTQYDQDRRSPGDRFCERASSTTDFEKVWPR